jgi:hypothetical protein
LRWRLTWNLCCTTDGRVLNTLPGVAVIRAAAFAAHTLPITKCPDAEHLYSATGLAPALYERPSCIAVAGSPGKGWPSTATR